MIDLCKTSVIEKCIDNIRKQPPCLREKSDMPGTKVNNNGYHLD